MLYNELHNRSTANLKSAAKTQQIIQQVHSLKYIGLYDKQDSLVYYLFFNKSATNQRGGVWV